MHAAIGDVNTQTPDEFCKYWKGDKSSPTLEFKGGMNEIRVINGPLYYSGEKAKEKWRNDTTLVTAEEYFSLIEKNMESNGYEMGVIVHCPSGFLLGEEIGKRITVKFSKEYSSVGNTYYDSVYIPLAESCNNNIIGNIDLFEKLWSEFAGNPLLEARIHLWKSLTLLGVKLKRGNVDAKKHIDDRKFNDEIIAIRANEKIKDHTDIINLIADINVVDDFQAKMNDPDFFKQLFPENI